MAIDPQLSEILGKVDPAEPLKIVFTLKPPVVATSATAPLIAPDIAARRAAFAAAATEAITAAIGQASADSGHVPADSTIFGNVGSAWLRAPAALVSALATNPAVASIGLDRNP